MQKTPGHSLPLCRSVLATLVGLILSGGAFAACDNLQPDSNETVTCDTTPPNPSTSGVAAVSGSDNVTVNFNAGTLLNLSGQNGVLLYSNSTAIQRGTINLTGDTFDGLSARLAGNTLQNVGTINTNGLQSEGLYSSGTDSQLSNAQDAQITTRGDSSSGIASFSNSPAGLSNNYLTNLGTVTTYGLASPGIYAQGSNNQLLNSGDITTYGDDASGIEGNGDNNVIVNSGTITTQGRAGNAINSGGGTALGSVTNSGKILTSGLFANGVYFGNTATFTNTAGGTITSAAARGVLATAGGTLTNNGLIHAGRDGIDSYYGVAQVTNTGTIISDNERAVHFDSVDNATLINSGDLTGNGVAVQFSGGEDHFIWQNSGTVTGSVEMDEGNDQATLQNLSDSNLAATTEISGGLGNDQLLLSAAHLSDPARFIDWESLLLRNGSQLTLNTPLVVGDAQTQTGSVSIDATSSLLAGGQSTASIAGYAGNNDVTVTNAGAIDLTDNGGSTTDRLTINGNYVGNNGVLKLQTVLNGDDSASDRLVISGGQASGTTQIQVTNVGGTGVATQNAGIMLVEATHGATTTAGAFTLAGGSVSAGAYEYLLFRGSSADAQSWYLRNSLIVPPVTQPETPPVIPPVTSPEDPPVTLPVVPPVQPAGDTVPLYRQEAPLYQAVMPVAAQIGIKQIGTFHERQGQLNTSGSQGDWARTFGTHSEQSWSGSTSPAFEGNYAGLQVGQDLLTGTRDNAGVFYGFTRAKGSVEGFIVAQPDSRAGDLTVQGNSAGAYWTHHWPGLAYLDAVVMQTWLSGSTTSGRGNRADVGGKLWSASLESGYPLGVAENWSLEPQAQLIGQRLQLDDSHDTISSITYSEGTQFTGRVGARLQGSYGDVEQRLMPFLSVNVWHDFNNTNTVTLANDSLNQDNSSTSLEVGMGLAASVSRQVELYSAVSHTSDDDSEHRQDLSGNLGVRVIW